MPGASDFPDLDLPQGMTVREPTGRAPWPFVVLEGPEGMGKTWAAVEATADPRFGPAWMITVGEVNADEYGKIPGARFRIIEHDGSYRQIKAAVDAVCKVPIDLAKPPILIFDSGSTYWDLLTGEADKSARTSQSNKRKLAADPDAEIVITPDRWNRAADRWNDIVKPLIQWGGLVLFTARGGEVAEIKNGQPTGDTKYRLVAHKSLAFDAQVIVRMQGNGRAMVTKAKSVTLQLPRRARGEVGLEMDEFSVASLLFDHMKLGTDMGQREFVADKREAESDQPVPVGAVKAEVVKALGGDKQRAQAIWQRAKLPNDGMMPRWQADGIVEVAQNDRQQPPAQQQVEVPAQQQQGADVAPEQPADQGQQEQTAAWQQPAEDNVHPVGQQAQEAARRAASRARGRAGQASGADQAGDGVSDAQGAQQKAS